MSDMTTSPVTTPEIEHIFGDADAPPPAPVPTSVLGEWQRFGTFLKSPRLPARGASYEGAARATIRMLWLDVPIMGLLIAGLMLAAALGFEVPNNVNAQLDPALLTISFVVIIAPLLEEIVFRSWLSGHPSILAGVAIGALGLGMLIYGETQADANPAMIGMMIAGIAIVLIGIPVAAILLRKRAVPGFFRSGFPIFYWLSAVAFALIHLSNYTEGALAILLVLVVPQFLLGLMLGYLRVHHGLIAAIALHAIHNGILITLAIAGGLGTEEASSAGQAFLLG